MAGAPRKQAILTPSSLLWGYAHGIFPMGGPNGAIGWYSADPRGILPLENLHVSKTLAAAIRQGKFAVGINVDFAATMHACRDAHNEGQWITDPLIEAYQLLHHMGLAHSVECRQNGVLVGGLYGVCLGGAFFGESMFHVAPDASKVALVYLVRRLQARGYQLLDTQAVTQHLSRLGAICVPAAEYLQRLERALKFKCSFAD